jgi:catechol 2,3-dioxygenase-like lactoylglutathione lyase family enzyme
MSDRRVNLAPTVMAMRPMVPAKDFATSKQFYCDLGFQPTMLTDDLAQMQLGLCSFLLQNYYVRDWADNFVIHLYVSHVQPWWDRIVTADLASRYGVRTRAPHRADWGATVAHLIDPAGVLWWFHETPPASGENTPRNE